MEYKYRRSMQKSELLLREENAILQADFYKDMFFHNHIPGVLPFVQEQEKNGYCYDITTKQSVAERYDVVKISLEQLQRLLRNIINIVDTGKKYLIDETDYVIRPECIFYAKDSEQVYLCCYPFFQKDLREQLIELIEYFMEKIDYSDSSAVVTIYELYMRCKKTSCDFSEILGVLNTAGAGLLEAEECRWTKTPESLSIEPEVEAELEEDRNEVGSKEMTEYYLQADRSEDSICITHFPLYIGKDAVAQESKKASVGKSQARISMRGDSVYIEDMKSVEGTFVNGRRIAGNEIQKLNQGDSVMLADRCYRFMRVG